MIRLEILGLAALLLIAGCSKSPDKAYNKISEKNAVILQNVAAAKEQDFEKTVAQLKGFVETHRNWRKAGEVRYSIAIMYLERKNYAKAVSELTDVYMNFPENYELCARSHYVIGAISERTGDIDQAIRKYWEVAERYPASRYGLEVPLYIAELYRRNAKNPEMVKAYEQATYHYERSIEENQNGRAARLFLPYLAKAWVALGKPDEALLRINKLADKYPDGVAAPYELMMAAQLARETQQIDKAIVFLAKLTAKYQQSDIYPEAVMGLGSLYGVTGDIEQAKRTFQTFKDKYSRDPAACARAQIGIAKCYEHNGKTDDALREYAVVGQSYPKTLEAIETQVLMAALYQKNNRPGEVMQAIDAAIGSGNGLIANSGDKAIAIKAAGMVAGIYFMQGKWQDGANAYQAAIQRYPKDPAAAPLMYKLAMVYKEKLNDRGKSDYYLALLKNAVPSGN